MCFSEVFKCKFIYAELIDDAKNDHLRALGGAAERLLLCKADLLDYDALRHAVDGCQGVFHTASPVTDDPVIFFFFSFALKKN